MSVHKELDRNGKPVYKVRWRHAGRQRARSFSRERDANLFNATVRLARERGELHTLDQRSSFTVEQYAERWWDRHVEPRLADSTKVTYDYALARVVAFMGGYGLREVRPMLVEDFIADMRKRKTGEPTIRTTLVVLQGMFRRALNEDLVESNPVRNVDKPAQKRARVSVLITPVQVEAMRAWMLSNKKRRYERSRLMDATLLSLLAYAGPRPESEALTLRWERVRGHVIEIKAGGKRGAVDRTIRLLAPLKADLSNWRMHEGRPRTGLVFGEWSGDDWDNWRERVWDRAAKHAKVTPGSRPRDLRGSFASLLIAEGNTVLEVARQLGHSPTTCLKHYAALFDDFDPALRVDPEQLIRDAREGRVAA